MRPAENTPRPVVASHGNDTPAVYIDELNERAKAEFLAETVAPHTPKQRLIAHLTEHHARAFVGHPHADSKRATLKGLQMFHRTQHHQYSSSHWHGPNPNLGPGNRPEGWLTGEDMHLNDGTETVR